MKDLNEGAEVQAMFDASATCEGPNPRIAISSFLTQMMHNYY